MPYDIFLSHAPQDQPTVDRIADFLQHQGLNCWTGAGAAGQPPEEAAAAALRDCLAVVLILSAAANHSTPLWQEAAVAVQGKKPLIPFRIEDVPPSEALEPLVRWLPSHDAYTPPLDRHLEDLLRVLRPLAARRRTEIADAALLSRTLPSRASLVRSDLTHRTRPRDATDPLSLTFNFDHPIVSGHASSFELLLGNVGLENLDEVEVVLENRNLRRTIVHRVSHLGVDKSDRSRLELEPFRSEQTVLHVTVSCRAGDRRLMFTGSRSLRIHQLPSAQELSLGPAWLADALRKRVAFSPSLGLKFATVPELLGFRLPEYLEPLTLSFDYEIPVEVAHRAETVRDLHIPTRFLDRACPGKKLVLEPVQTPALPHQELRLVAPPRFVLGRSPEEADYLLWFWPRGDINDTKTRRLSKKHCSLTVQGGKIFVANLAAASLMTMDGQDLPVLEDALLDHRGVLNFSGIYFLEVTHFPASPAVEPNITNLASWAGAANPAEPPTASGAVRFVPLTPHVLPQQAVWLLSSVTFGTSKANPLELNIEGLDEIQGRFHHYLGCFWLENLAGNRALFAGDHILAAGEIVPLAAGMTLRLGGRDFRTAISA